MRNGRLVVAPRQPGSIDPVATPPPVAWSSVSISPR